MRLVGPSHTKHASNIEIDITHTSWIEHMKRTKNGTMTKPDELAFSSLTGSCHKSEWWAWSRAWRPRIIKIQSIPKLAMQQELGQPRLPDQQKVGKQWKTYVCLKKDISQNIGKLCLWRGTWSKVWGWSCCGCWRSAPWNHMHQYRTDARNAKEWWDRMIFVLRPKWYRLFEDVLGTANSCCLTAGPLERRLHLLHFRHVVQCCINACKRIQPDWIIKQKRWLLEPLLHGAIVLTQTRHSSTHLQSLTLSDCLGQSWPSTSAARFTIALLLGESGWAPANVAVRKDWSEKLWRGPSDEETSLDH